LPLAVDNGREVEAYSPGTVLTARGKSLGLWAGRQSAPTCVRLLSGGKIGIAKWAEDEEWGDKTNDKGANR